VKVYEVFEKLNAAMGRSLEMPGGDGSVQTLLLLLLLRGE
jgi:hypothetical protein